MSRHKARGRFRRRNFLALIRVAEPLQPCVASPRARTAFRGTSVRGVQLTGSPSRRLVVDACGGLCGPEALRTESAFSRRAPSAQGKPQRAAAARSLVLSGCYLFAGTFSPLVEPFERGGSRLDWIVMCRTAPPPAAPPRRRTQRQKRLRGLEPHHEVRRLKPIPQDRFSIVDRLLDLLARRSSQRPPTHQPTQIRSRNPKRPRRLRNVAAVLQQFNLHRRVCHAALGLRCGPWPNNRADEENQLQWVSFPA